MNVKDAEANSKLIEQSKHSLQNKASRELEQKQKNEEILEKRRIILKSLLTPEANERLSRIRIVKEEKARQIEDIILMNSQRGLIRNKLEDEQLISIIEQVSEIVQKKEPKIQIKRKKQFDDDDDFNEDDYM